MSTVPGWRHPPRIRAALAAVWFGTSLGVAALGAPSVFAVLPGSQAGPIVGRMLEREATLGLVLGALLIGLEHLQSRARAEAGLPGPRFSVELLLALGQDAFAQPLEASLRDAGVQMHIVRSTTHATGTAFICVSDDAENAITVAPGANGALGPGDLPALQGFMGRPTVVNNVI